MKIAFLSNRPWGQLGTPGTFGLIEAFASFANVRVFALPNSTLSVVDRPSVPIVPLTRSFGVDCVADILPPLTAFGPDLIYVFNDRAWPLVVQRIKEQFPTVPIVLDVKTPLLAVGKSREAIQAEGKRAQSALESIVSLSKESVLSWIPDCHLPIHEYPLGLDSTRFRNEQRVAKANASRWAFVYLSSLHSRRRTKDLIDGFVRFVRQTGVDAHLDIYGDGPDAPSLRCQIDNAGASSFIELKGLVSQQSLMNCLCEYDCGVAWVPKETYDQSPSLKLIEYMAAGIPVLATATEAHLKMERAGFRIQLFDDDVDSAARAFVAFVQGDRPDDMEVISNTGLVSQFDFKKIVQERLLPYLSELMVPQSQLSQVSCNSSRRADNENAIFRDRLGESGSESSRAPLKIALVCDSMAQGKGGAEKVASDLAGVLAERGDLIYAIYRGSGAPAYKLHDGIVALPYENLDYAAEAIRELDFDMAIVFYFNPSPLHRFIPIFHRCHVPMIFQECSNPMRILFNNWRSGKFSRAKAIWQRELIASMAARIRLTIQTYEESFPDILRFKVRGFPNPARPAPYDVADPDNMVDGGNIVIVNGLKGNKNLATLIEAFALVSSKSPTWRLTVVGALLDRTRSFHDEIGTLVDRLGIAESVEFKGPVEDMPAEYARCQIHVIASLSEGCPNVVLEAMGAGVPSIGFEDCPGTNWLIKHERNGLLAGASDRVQSLAQALSRLISDPELRSRLGRNAYEDAAEFDPDVVYGRWRELIEGALLETPESLHQKQAEIDAELALHYRRSRSKLFPDIEPISGQAQ